MGGAKAAYMAEQEAAALSENLEMLLDEGYLDEGTAAYGIAKQIIGKGKDSLTDKQHDVFENIIADKLERMATVHEVQRLVNKDN